MPKAEIALNATDADAKNLNIFFPRLVDEISMNQMNAQTENVSFNFFFVLKDSSLLIQTFA